MEWFELFRLLQQIDVTGMKHIPRSWQIDNAIRLVCTLINNMSHKFDRVDSSTFTPAPKRRMVLEVVRKLDLRSRTFSAAPPETVI
jgi:hypothetical protein